MPPIHRCGMILAAGRGERLRPLTDRLPKPLIRIGGRCLIEYQLQTLSSAGIRRVVINLAYLGDMIEAQIGSGERYGLSIAYSREPDGAMGTGGGIRQALPLIDSDPFIVLNSDIWTDLCLGNLPKQIDTKAHLILVDNPPHNPAGDFFLAEDRVLNYGVAGARRLTFSGIGVYRHSLFDDTPEGRFPLATCLKEAADRNLVSGEHFPGRWTDIGSHARLDQARQRTDSRNDR